MRIKIDEIAYEFGSEKEDLSVLKQDNPEWDKDWSAGCAGVGEVGDFQDKMKKTHPGWNDVLHKVSKMPGANVKPL